VPFGPALVNTNTTMPYGTCPVCGGRATHTWAVSATELNTIECAGDCNQAFRISWSLFPVLLLAAHLRGPLAGRLSQISAALRAERLDDLISVDQVLDVLTRAKRSETN
jgi:hypothetical protein